MGTCLEKIKNAIFAVLFGIIISDDALISSFEISGPDAFGFF